MKKRVSIGFLATGLALCMASCHQGASRKDHATKMEVINDRPITDTLTQDPEHFPVLSVSDTLHDFGTIEQGDVVEYAFHFKNTGSKPLIISQAASTCGCTVPEYPKKPVAPGADGVLKVVFNSAGKSGRQVKPVFIQANTKPTHVQLTITCNVVKSLKNQD